ncbi:MAG: type II toxin-antitoxin system HicB family antitoxin [Candidatus Marinimicrobia bacterium]|nr:type II toxin-antitoxin system HicB family antitoxin [Candidatus Neomarinimicrobiota bacterium]MBL7010227.1 type II toxin-antitoxin system HicB family antitoxin [Candidatus Neomarinimicrobiota bacterium]MBL7030642.1 type II toxin-antitoxin system HicB family antitoxin [Candidatus Neomarinimicrobiota bacterium]
MKVRDKYLKIVEWSEEDQCYVGSVPGWLGPCCHGDNEEKVYKELCQVVDEWVDIYKEDNQQLPQPTNKQYSGKFILRTGPDLHKALAVRAVSDGDSLNKYVVKKLKSIL